MSQVFDPSLPPAAFTYAAKQSDKAAKHRIDKPFAFNTEGGARQFVGPTAALQLLDDRLTLVAGPSLGLSDRSPQLLGRFALSYGF
jgi:hypothetical protein